MTSYRNDLNRLTLLDLPWEKLEGCSVLVTGATGLIGSCLVEALLHARELHCKVYALGRNDNRAKTLFSEWVNSERFCFIQHDILDPLPGQTRFDYIIHAAGGSGPGEFVKHPVEVIMANIVGVSNLMEYGLGHGMKRFLFISSGEVYGEGDGRVFTEDYSGYVDCTSPRSCYPASKRAAESLCVSYSAEYGADVVIARPCHVYGPHFTENDNRVFAQFIRDVVRGKDIVMKSNGEQFRSWCYVVDCVSALLYILLRGESCQAYNIADEGSTISIYELAQIIASVGGKNIVRDIPDFNEARGFNVVTRSVFCVDKLKDLGWKPQVHIYEGLKRTIEESVRLSNDSAFKNAT